MTLPARCPTVSYLFPSHFGQFIQINIDEVEFHSIWRLALRMQDFFHQDIEEKLDSAEENNTHGSVNYSTPTLCSSPQENSHVCSLATLRNSARLSAFSKEKSNPWNGYKCFTRAQLLQEPLLGSELFTSKDVLLPTGVGTQEGRHQATKLSSLLETLEKHTITLKD